MDMTGAAMTVARKPETGRHYLSDRCPVASDGRGREKEGKRERSSSSLRTGRNNAISGVETTSTDRPDASSYDSARASDQTRSRIPALQTQDRRIYISNLICTDGEFRDGVSLRILHDAVIAS